MPTVLTIAGFDPSCGAGITADLAVFAAHGFFGTSCLTALTVQNTLGVASVQPVDTAIVRATLDHLHADLPPAGIKIGMLATAATVAAVTDYLESSRPRTIVVLDPVLRSTSGAELLDAPGVALLRERLLPLVDWVTPNHDELALLTGSSVGNRREIEEAAAALQSAYPNLAVLATGGHHDPPDDLLLARGEAHWLSGGRVDTQSTHGTGCALSSALLCRLVQHHSSFDAASAAKHYVTEALRRATPIGHGRGPMNLLWPLTTR